MLANYFKTAWRNIVSQKLFSVINILGLAIGISACLITYLITHFELGYDTFHHDKDRIYRLVARMQDKNETRKFGFVMTPLPASVRNEISGLEKVAAFYNYYAKVTVPGGEKEVRKFEQAKMGEEVSDIIVAEPEYFDLFRYQWLAGKPETALKEPFKLVLSAKEAHKYFGNLEFGQMIGKQVVYNDSLYLTVSGIVKDWDQNTDFAFKDFISFATVQHSFLKNDIDLSAWGMWDFDSQGFVKLAKGVTPAQVEKQFPEFLNKHLSKSKQSEYTVQLALQPLSDIHFNEDYVDAYSRKVHLPTLYGLMAIAAFILILAAINFINLSIARSIQKAREIGLRKVLGGSRTDIILQFLSETTILTLAAVLLSVSMIRPMLSAAGRFLPPNPDFHPLSIPVLSFLGLITVVTILLAGFYPARILSSASPALGLRGQVAAKAGRKAHLQKGLIVFQFTISLIFIVGTITVASQIRYLLHKDLGFTKDAIITLRTSNNYPLNKREVLADKIRQIASVQLVSQHMETPLAKGHPGTFIIYRGKEEAKVDASFDMCDPSYVPLFGLRIIAGRNIFPADTIREFLINETCARQLGFSRPADAIGKQVEIGMNAGTGPVVGILADFHSKSLHEAITPFFISSFKRAERDISIKLSTSGKNAGDLNTTLGQIGKDWREVYPNEKFSYSFLDDSIEKLYDKEQKTSALMTIAMGIAIFISCIGLFGLVTFMAEQRTKEIGIRKVLGASVINIVTMLSGNFLGLVLLAIFCATPIAYYFMNQWLQHFAYRIRLNGWVFFAADLAGLFIASVTLSFQAVKVALSNPVRSLRSE
jgi:putative ABC transport system permease protein